MSTFSRKNKGQILFSLSMFVMFFIVLAGASFQQLDKSEKLRLADEVVERLDVHTLYLFRNDVDFYNYDLINPAFYTEPNTPLLRRHDSLLVVIDSLIRSVRSVEDFQLEESLLRVDSLVHRYDMEFNALKTALRNKGFKDYGLEGELRAYAHTLEDKKLISPNEILTLRRHEKDYLLRDDKQYAARFNALSAELRSKYRGSLEAFETLGKYTGSFNELVQLADSIGFHSQTGRKGELNAVTSQLLRALDALNAQGEEQTAQNQRKTFNSFVFAVVFAIIFCGVLIFVTAKSL